MFCALVTERLVATLMQRCDKVTLDVMRNAAYTCTMYVKKFAVMNGAALSVTHGLSKFCVKPTSRQQSI